MSRVTEFLFCFCRLSSALNELYYDIAKTKKCDEVPNCELSRNRFSHFCGNSAPKRCEKSCLRLFSLYFLGLKSRKQLLSIFLSELTWPLRSHGSQKWWFVGFNENSWTSNSACLNQVCINSRCAPVTCGFSRQRRLKSVYQIPK